MKPWDFQETAVNKAIEHLNSGERVLLYSPTGSGKTVMSAMAIDKAFRDKKIIFLVNLQVLIGQTYTTLKHFDLDCSVFHNEIKKTVTGDVMEVYNNNSNIVITLIETFFNGELDFVPDLIIIDEAHKSTSATYQEFRDMFPEAKVLGLSASPRREANKEGESLEEWYDVMVDAAKIRDLIDRGILAKPVYKIFPEGTHAVNTWKEFTKDSDNKRTLVFTYDTTHSVKVLQAFTEAGISAEMVTSGSDNERLEKRINTQTPNQRNAIFKRFAEGKVDVLISVMALCEGFDEKLAKYCMLLRKVAAVSLYHQMVGRVIRSHPEKSEGYILDFCENVKEHGMIEEYDWSLQQNTKHIVKSGETIYFGNYERKPKIFVCCEKCHNVYNATETTNCSGCGSASNITISTSIKQIIEHFEKIVDAKVWCKFKNNKFVKDGAEFWEFVEIAKRAKDRNIGYKFNSMYCEIFEDNSTFKKEYSWIESIDNKKMRKTDRIEYRLVA